MKKKYLLIFLMFAFCKLTCLAQSQSFFHKNITIADGLSSNAVFDIHQDKQGYLWFGTNAGVCKYDGENYTYFTLIEGLLNNTVFDLIEDYNGRLWCRSFNNKLCYIKNDSVIPYQYNYLIDSLKANELSRGYDFIIDSLDNLILGCPSGSVEINAKGRLKSNLNIDLLKFVSVNYSSNGGLPISYTQSNYDFDELIVNGQSFQLPPRSPMHAPFVNSLTINGSTIITYNNFYCVLDSNRNFSTTSGKNTVTRVYKDSENKIWMTYKDGGGIKVFKSIEEIKQDNSTYHFLDGKHCTSIIEDHEGGFWVSTLYNGVFYFPLVAKFIPVAYENIPNISNDNKNFYFSTTKELYKIYSDTLTTIKELNNWHSSPFFLNIKQNTCLVRGDGKLIEIDKSGRVVNTNYVKEHLSDRKLIQLKNGNYILVGIGGLIELSEGIELFNSLNEYETSYRLYSAYQDFDNTIWVVGKLGLFKYENKKLIKQSQPSLFNTSLTCIAQLSDSTLVIGSSGLGLILWKGDEIKHLSLSGGLASNKIKDIHIAENGKIWLSTSRGISVLTYINFNDIKIRNIAATNNANFEVAKISTLGNKMAIATNKGILMISDLDHAIKTASPIVSLKQISVNNIKTKRSQLTALTFRENNIELKLAAISFHNPKVMLRYRLDGDWIYTENKNISIERLPYNNYELIIQKQNKKGAWINAIEPIAISIAPPWYLQTWFMVISIVLFILLMVLFFKWRTLRNERILQTEKQKRDLITSELVALRSQMNPHFLFNTLNSIQNYILTNEPLSASDYLSDFAKLMRKILSNSKASTISLVDEVETLELYVKLEQLRHSGKFKFKLNMDKTIADFIEIPSMLIQPYIENAIIHGLAQKENKDGLLQLTIKLKGDHLVCTIEDNGIGIEEAIKLKQGEQQKSMGMDITKRRLDLINLKTKTKVTQQIINLRDEHGVSNGTQAKIYIPLIEH